MAFVDKFKPNWRLPNCGGPDIHGTELCCIDDVTGMFQCHCHPRPSNFNYELHYQLAISIYDAQLHLDVSCAKWDTHCLALFSTGGLKHYQQCQGFF